MFLASRLSTEAVALEQRTTPAVLGASSRRSVRQYLLEGNWARLDTLLSKVRQGPPSNSLKYNARPTEISAA